MADVQIDANGELIDSAESSYFLLDESLAGNVTNVPSSDIYPQIHTPLNTEVIFLVVYAQSYCILNTQALKEVIPLLKIVLKHNFVSGLLVMAGCIMSLHYSAVIKLNSGCPMIMATGKSETGKSTAIKTAMAFTGVFCVYKWDYLLASNC